MSQQKRRFEASAKHCRLFQKHNPLCAPGREWGAALRAGSSSTGSTKSESNPSVGFPVNNNCWARSERFQLFRQLLSYYGAAEINEKRDERAILKSIDRWFVLIDRKSRNG